MFKKQEKELPPASPLDFAISTVGNKWRLYILKCLMSRELPWHLTELKNEIPGIDQTVLKVTLQSMEKDGLVVSKVFRDLPPRVEFSISELGASTQTILAAMEAWGETYGH